jgi:hypothetical protein
VRSFAAEGRTLGGRHPAGWPGSVYAWISTLATVVEGLARGKAWWAAGLYHALGGCQVEIAAEGSVVTQISRPPGRSCLVTYPWVSATLVGRLRSAGGTHQ